MQKVKDLKAASLDNRYLQNPAPGFIVSGVCDESSLSQEISGLDLSTASTVELEENHMLDDENFSLGYPFSSLFKYFDQSSVLLLLFQGLSGASASRTSSSCLSGGDHRSTSSSCLSGGDHRSCTTCRKWNSGHENDNRGDSSNSLVMSSKSSSSTFSAAWRP